MPETKGQNFQNVQESALTVTGLPSRSNNEDIVSALDQDKNQPLRLFESTTPDANLNIAAQEFQMYNGVGKSVPPINNQIPDFVASTINFQTQATTGGTINITWPTSTVGQYRLFGITLLSSGEIETIFSEEQATLGALPNPGTVFVSGGLPIGWLELECTNVAGYFKTAGSTTNIIENKVGSDSRIHLFGAGGGSGGTGNADAIWQTMVDETAFLPYEFLSGCVFTLDGDTRIDVSSTGSYNIADSSYDVDNTETFITENMLSADFLNEELDVSTVRLKVVYDIGNEDSNPNIDVSRDGGNEYQDFTQVERIGETNTWIAKHSFEVEASNQTLIEKAVGSATTTQELTATSNNQAFSQEFTDTVAEVVKALTIYVNKTGSPLGQLIVKLVKDDTGNPSSDLNDILAEKYVQIPDIGAGNQSITLNFDAILLASSKYHVVFETDSVYKGSYVASTTSIAVRTDNSTAVDIMKQYNGSAWATLASNQIVYLVEGRELDLKIKITASETSKIKGIGVWYGEEPNASSSALKTQVFPVTTDGGIKTLPITDFTPDKNLLEVIIPSRGQIFRQDPSTFTIEGNDLVFVNDFFKDLPAQTISVIVDQNRATTFDSSDDNRAILNENHLGSQISSRDSSIAGRGILLRRPDGTLRELTITNSDTVSIISV